MHSLFEDIRRSQQTIGAEGNSGMNWDQIEGQWKRWSGPAMLHWEKIMDDAMATVTGSHDNLVKKGRKKYGIAKEEARQQVDNINIADQLIKSNNCVIGFQKSMSKKKIQKHYRGMQNITGKC
jgi:uncharacterized protein YjbJ (UPF0337 family)